MIAHRPRYSRIRDLTLEILARSRIVEPAVPIDKMLIDAGIEIRRGALGEVSGLITRNGSRTVIGINSDQAPTRQRFTMAHEYGHHLLHRDIQSHSDTNFRVRYRDRTSSEATDVEEIEANFFAATLLMPKPFLDARDAAEALGDDEAVRRLADVFQVSGHAMSLRLVNEYSHQRPY